MEGRIGLGGNCVGLNLGAERRCPEALRLLQPVNWQFGVHGRSGLGALNKYTEASHQQPPGGKKKKSINLICGSACLNKTFQRLPSDKEQPAGLIATAGFALPGNFPARKKKCARIYSARVPIFQAGGRPFSATGFVLGARPFFLCRRSNHWSSWPQPLVVK